MIGAGVVIVGSVGAIAYNVVPKALEKRRNSIHRARTTRSLPRKSAG